MIPTTRQVIAEYLVSKFATSVTGSNNKTVQYQGEEDGLRWYGCYDKNGDFEFDTSDINKALNYIGL